MIAVDTETTGLNPWRTPSDPGLFFPARPFAISICDTHGKTKFFRFEVDPTQRKVLYQDKPTLVRSVQKILSTPQPKVFHNASFDLNMLNLAGFDVNGKVYDTKTMAHIVTGGSEPSYGLKPLCKKWFGFSDVDQKELHKTVVKARRQAKKNNWCIATKEHFGNGYVLADMWLGERSLLRKYSVQDAERTMLMFQFLKPKIDEDEGFKEVLERENALLRELIAMQRRGVRVFIDRVAELETYYQKHIDKANALRESIGYGDLNINSPIQIRKVFIEEREHEPIKYTAKGNVSVDNEVLTYYANAEGDELAKAIVEWKVADKGLNNFMKAYRKFAVAEDSKTHVIHTSFNNTAAVTGRLSSSDPNLMQVASEKTHQHTEVTNRSRECFGPREGHVWYLPDYSQIEVWLFAFQAQSEIMMTALLAGEDFHSFNAKTIWGDRPDFKEQFSYYRKRGKIIMFLKQYGGGIDAVASEIGCPRYEAQQFVNMFEHRLPDVPAFINRMQNKARRLGNIRNPFGRLYKFRNGMEYKAVNYLIQGTAAEVMKNAIVYVNTMLRERWPGVQILLTIHDELVIEVPLCYHSKRLMHEIIFEMQHDSERCGLPVPFPVEMKWTSVRWNKTRKVKLAA